MKNSSRTHPPWADLPQELLSTIANFLTSNPIDILTFRAICKSWYSSSPSPSPFNLSHMLPITSPYPCYSFDIRFHERNFGLPIISVTAIFALGRQQLSRNTEQDTKCWLMFVDQLTPGKLMIRQPLTKYHYSMPLSFPSCLDVPNIHHIDEIGRFYNLSFHPAVNKPPSIWSEYVHKVVLNSDESSAVALFHSGQLGLSRLSMSPYWDASGWGPIYTFGYENGNARIDDIVYHKERVFAVDRVGRLNVVEFSSSVKNLIVSKLNGSGIKRKRLVESNGVIYLVVSGSVHRAGERGIQFKIFKLDEDIDEWVEVSSIGDMVFFFGLDFSFSISPKKLGSSIDKNCIVYVEHSFKDYIERVDDDVTIFSNLKHGDLRVGVWHMDAPYHCGVIWWYPGYSNVLWPPPSWLWPIDMSKRIGILEAALDDLLVNAPADKLKAMAKVLPPLEHALVVNDDANQQDCSGMWRVAHTAQLYLKEAKDVHKYMESIKLKNALVKEQPYESINFQDQASGSSSRGTEEWQGSANSEADDEFISREMKLNGMLLCLEETTTKLQRILKPRQQPCVDVVE